MSHFTKNSMQSSKALWIMATVVWTKALKSTTFSKESRVLSWRLQAQPKMYHKDFDGTVSYLGKMVVKKGNTMQSIPITKTAGQQAKPRVAAFMGKIECKKYPKAVWNSMSREKQMQDRKLFE